jgi:hypothetical protein
LMTLSQALIGEAIPPRERARFQGYLAAVAVCANSFGPVAGGYLTEHFGWRSVFLINVPIGIVAVLLIGKLQSRVPEKSNWQPDPLGLALFTLFVTATILALEHAQQLDRSTLPVLGALITAGVVALVLLVRQERRAPSPLIPLSLLSLPAIWRSDALICRRCHPTTRPTASIRAASSSTAPIRTSRKSPTACRAWRRGCRCCLMPWCRGARKCPYQRQLSPISPPAKKFRCRSRPTRRANLPGERHNQDGRQKPFPSCTDGVHGR